MTTDYSRALLMGVAASATDEQGLRQQLESVRVHVTAEPSIPGVITALKVLLGDLRRLPIEISLDPGHGLETLPDQVLADIVRTTLGIDAARPVKLTADAADLNIHLGPHRPTEAVISAVPDGHGVRLRRGGAAFPTLRAPGTGLGAVLTAASLTAEVFKQITGLKPGSYRQLTRLDFCPVTLSTRPGAFAPTFSALPPTALVGAGAIGTAIAVILDALGVTGHITVTDPETYEPPNVTTYSLGSRTDAQEQILKVDLLTRELHRAGRVHVVPIQGTAQDLITRIDQGSAPWPTVVLSGVDSVDARHETQRIYADLTLDGSTGGQAGTTLALHEALPLGPCLRCYYPPRAETSTNSAETRLHEATGLPITRIAKGDEPLARADLAVLPTAAREILQPYLGKPLCGLSNLVGLVSGPAGGYRPSATFVAQQAASLVIGALIARTTGMVDGPPRHIEYDARYGPQDFMSSDRKPRQGCACQNEQPLIQRIRNRRAKV